MDTRVGMSGVGDADAVTLLAQLAGAAAGKDIGQLVAAAVELGRRIERGEVANGAVPDIASGDAMPRAKPANLPVSHEPAPRRSGLVRCPTCRGGHDGAGLVHAADCTWDNRGRLRPGTVPGPMSPTALGTSP